MSWFKRSPRVKEPTNKSAHKSSPLSETLLKETRELHKHSKDVLTSEQKK